VESIDKQRQPNRSPSSLDVMREEIDYQIEDLPLFSAELIRRAEIRKYDPSKIVFTGSGDSYSSSLFAHYLSGGLATVSDPYELYRFPRNSKDKTVFITSITGRTIANVQLGRRLRIIARRRIAVTANPTSKLAQACDEIIPLKYRTRGILTSGTTSFTSSLVALAAQIQPPTILGQLDNAMKRASRWARQVKLGSRRRFVFVGSGIGHAIGAYGAFKIQEVLGMPADYQHTEQLGHSQLFSLDKSVMIICVVIGRDEKTNALCRALRKSGFGAFMLEVNSTNTILSALEASFAVQHLALGLARDRGQIECTFLSDDKLLNLSSRLIY